MSLQENPNLEFEPLFFVIDKCKTYVMAVKRQDKYELSGVYVKWDLIKAEWVIWPANFNSQLPWEFPERFVITKDAQEAWFYCEVMSPAKDMTDDFCLTKFPRNPEFPIY